MPRKKKPFIDRKKARKYQVVFSTRREDEDENSGGQNSTGASREEHLKPIGRYLRKDEDPFQNTVVYTAETAALALGLTDDASPPSAAAPASALPAAAAAVIAAAVPSDEECDDVYDEEDASDDDLPPLEGRDGAVIGSKGTSQGSGKWSYNRQEFEFAHLGLGDGYDYSKHFREIGHGTFVPKDGGLHFDPKEEQVVTLVDEEDKEAPLRAQEEQNRRELAQLDDDVVKVLEGDLSAEEDLEPLDDDFLDLAGGVAEAEDLPFYNSSDIPDPTQTGFVDKRTGEKIDFDMAAHTAKLLAELGDSDEEFLTDDEEEDMHGYGAHMASAVDMSNMPEHRQLYEEQFLAALKEYDDDQLGELDADDPRIQGVCSTHAYAAIFEKFENENKPLSFQEVMRLVREDDDAAQPLDASGRPTAAQTASEAARITVARLTYAALEQLDHENEENTRSREETEQMMRDQIEYLHEKPKPQWDAETIKTTLTNTENHPTVIDVGPVRPIRISSKTGAPSVESRRKPDLDEEDEEDGEYTDEEVVNEGVARPKGETREEKRERKKAIKEQRRLNRQRKKELKTAFKDETNRQANERKHATLKNHSIVKY